MYARLVAAAVLAVGSLGLVSTASALELRLSVETPPSHVRNQAAQRWADEVAKLTNGDVTITVFPSAQLYDSAGAVKALASGALDLSIQSSNTMGQFEPNLTIAGLPMFFGATREQLRAILDGPLGDELYEMVHSKLQIRVVGPHFEFAPNETAYTTKKKITSYADLEGVKLATPPSPTIVAILRTIGANAVATPRNEIELQLTQGTIDGLGLVTDLTISGGKLWDAGIKYGWHDDAGWGFYIPLVSQATWDKLTADQQKALTDGWKTASDWAREQTKTDLDAAIDVNKSHGIEFSFPSAEDLAATREKLLAAQGEIVDSTRMDADFVGKVQARLKELQN